jgi:hypothetical protein
MNAINEISNKHHIEFDLQNLGCPDAVAQKIAGGTTFAPLNPQVDHPFVYVAGPMRGLPEFNFLAFDDARNVALAKGYNVISPADIDRKAGDTSAITGQIAKQYDYFIRDVWSLYYLAHLGPCNGIVLLPGWQRSAGASAEFFNSRWLSLRLFKAVRHEMELATAEALIREFALYWISAVTH